MNIGGKRGGSERNLEIDRKKTIEQTEIECGIRMAAYMTLIRSIDVNHLRADEIISKVNKYVACERNFTKELAACRRSDIHRMLENEQQLIKKGV